MGNVPAMFRRLSSFVFPHAFFAEISMPTTVNGIGTHYYFKKNEVVQSALCEFCKQHSTLRDYETGLWFVVIFIPIFPLGKKMIIGQCDRCQMHRAMPLRDWVQAREEAIGSSLQTLSEKSADPLSALQLLGTYTAFNQFTEAQELAGAINASHPDDYDTQLALGSWYEKRGQHGEAGDCFKNVLRIDFDRPESKRIRVFDHVDAKQWSAAKKLTQELYAQDKNGILAVAILVAYTLQKAEQHAEAYDLFQMMVSGHADLVKDRDFRVAVRKTETALNRTPSIVPKKWLGIFA